MQSPPSNFTDIKTTVRGTFNEVLNDLIKPPPIRNIENIYSQQQPQPHNNNSPFIPINYNRSQFGKTFNNMSIEPRQNPIILQPGEFSFQDIEPEYKPDFEDKNEEVLRIGFKDEIKKNQKKDLRIILNLLLKIIKHLMKQT